MDVVMIMLVCLLAGGVNGGLQIVQPLPGHRVAIENQTLTVTCVAFDEEHPDVKPLGFDFYQLNQLGQKKPITDNTQDYSITNRTELNGRKLFSSLLFKRIKSTDNGRYECKIQNTTAVAYGFGITYVPYASLPKITVSRNITAEFGDEVSLVCNLTNTGNHFVNLKTISWIKDGERMMLVPRPKEGQLRDIDLTISEPLDGGHYSCKLTMLLHQQRTYNITRLTVLKVKPRFYALDLRNNKVVRNKGEAVEFNCNATGNPITIVWKRKPRNEDRNITITMKGYSYNESHYKISSETQYEGFRLAIPHTDYTDRGYYYCCIRDSNTSAIDVQCQRFVLRVKDPLRYLWPVIGIAIEGLVLLMILAASKRFKKLDVPSQSSDQERVEFSYTSSDGNKKEGRIRLRRQTGSTTATL